MISLLRSFHHQFLYCSLSAPPMFPVYIHMQTQSAVLWQKQGYRTCSSQGHKSREVLYREDNCQLTLWLRGGMTCETYI